MRANQVRLYLSVVAYVVLRALRQHGLKDTPLAAARVDTLRVQLLKFGARVVVSVRRVVVSLAEAAPIRAVFARVWQNLRELVVPREAVPASG